MNYAGGQEARVGDRVRIGYDDSGVVIFSIDRDEYGAGYPKAEWGGFVKAGVMIDFPKYGLIHFVEEDQDLELISRATREDESG